MNSDSDSDSGSLWSILYELYILCTLLYTLDITLHYIPVCLSFGNFLIHDDIPL